MKSTTLIRLGYALTSMLLLGAIWPAIASQKDQPSVIEVWADVVFDTEGRASQILLVDKDRYTPALRSALMAQLSNVKVPPRTLDGQPATFETGLRVQVGLQGGQSLSVLAVAAEPRPLTVGKIKWPELSAEENARGGSIQLSCVIDPEGACTDISIKADAGITQEVRNALRRMMRGFRFLPQKVGGQPIRGEFRLIHHFGVDSSRPPAQFGKEI